MLVMKHNGWLEVICGSMFSGKSEELIRRIRRAVYAKRNIQVFKPMIDNRYSNEAVVSHNGTSILAKPIAHSFDIMDFIQEETDVVGIDEVQFFDKSIVPVVEKLVNSGIQVIVAGLDTDFRGEPFGSIPALMAKAESVTKLHAICVQCGSPANRTQRLINNEPAAYDDPIILVGASESYEPRCRHCHDVPKQPEVNHLDRGSQSPELTKS